MSHPLDNAAWASLAGPHAALAQRHGRALRYPPDVSPFAALPLDAGDEDWRDLAVLVGPGGRAVLTGSPRTAPAGWESGMRDEGLQFDGSALAVAPDPEAVPLGPGSRAVWCERSAR